MEQPGGEHRAGVPGRDDRVGAALGDGDVRGDERRVGLAPHRLGRLLVHLDQLRRLDEREPVRVEAGRAEERRRRSPSAAASSAPATISPGARSPPRASTATRAKASGLRSRSAERLDLAALVRVARRADAVRPLGLMAGRADVDARRLDAVLRAALVATGLRCFLLGDCHERLRSIASSVDRPGRRDGLEEAAVVGDDDERAVVRLQRRLELLDRLQVEVVRRLVEDEAVDAAWPSARRGARASARPARASRTAAATCSAPRLNFASSVRASSGGRPARAVNASSSVSSPSYAARRWSSVPTTVARPSVARARGERQLAEQEREQRRLAAAVPARHRDALAGREVEVDRAEPERRPARRRRPRARRRGRRAAAPRRARGAAPTARTASRRARSARATARPGAPSPTAPACRAGRSRPSRARGSRRPRAPGCGGRGAAPPPRGAAPARRRRPRTAARRASSRAAAYSLQPPAYSLDAAGPRSISAIRVDRPVEEDAVVRDDDEPAREPVDEALEPVEPVEVEVVRRLVEQEHVEARQQDRRQRGPRRLAAGERRRLLVERDGEPELGARRARPRLEIAAAEREEALERGRVARRGSRPRCAARRPPPPRRRRCAAPGRRAASRRDGGRAPAAGSRRVSVAGVRSTRPSSGSSSPASSRSSVDLPAPFGPTSPSRERGPSVRSTWSRTVRAPKRADDAVE